MTTISLPLPRFRFSWAHLKNKQRKKDGIILIKWDKALCLELGLSSMAPVGGLQQSSKLSLSQVIVQLSSWLLSSLAHPEGRRKPLCCIWAAKTQLPAELKAGQEPCSRFCGVFNKHIKIPMRFQQWNCRKINTSPLKPHSTFEIFPQFLPPMTKMCNNIYQQLNRSLLMNSTKNSGAAFGKGNSIPKIPSGKRI